MSIEVGRRRELSTTMLKYILKRNHESFMEREQERLEINFINKQRRDSNSLSCEEIVFECLDWNTKIPEEKVDFMIRTPKVWNGSFIKPTNGFCKINKVVMDQNISIPRPEVDAISFVKYNLKHSDGLLTPWDLMNCKEMLYQEEIYKKCKALLQLCLDWNRFNQAEKVQFAIKTPTGWNHERIKATDGTFQKVSAIGEKSPRTSCAVVIENQFKHEFEPCGLHLSLETQNRDDDINNCAETPITSDHKSKHQTQKDTDISQDSRTSQLHGNIGITNHTVHEEFHATVAIALADRDTIYNKYSRFRFSSLHRFSTRPSKLPIMIPNPLRNYGVPNLYSSVSRIPIRINGYIWASMNGKTLPVPIRSFPGSKIPIRITPMVMQNISKNALSPRDQDEIEKKNVVKLPEIMKRKSKIPVRIRGYVWNLIGSTDFDQRQRESETRRKLAPISKIPVLTSRPSVIIPRLDPEEHLPHINVDLADFMDDPWQQDAKMRNKSISTLENKHKEMCDKRAKLTKQMVKPAAVIPKPARLPPIEATRKICQTIKQRDIGSRCPSNSPSTPSPSRHSDLNMSSNACLSVLSLCNSMHDSRIKYDSLPACVTRYTLLPPIGGAGKPRPVTAGGKKKLPPINIGRPVSACGYAKLPPIARII